MRPFSVQAPRIAFGAGERSRIPALAADTVRGGPDSARAVVLTGPGRGADPEWQRWLGEALAALEPRWLICPRGEPTVESVDSLVREARRLGPDLIVAVGGGSVLDTAKAISVLAPLGDSVLEYLEGVGGGSVVPRPGIPWIALPTTAGTGAEATWNAVVKSVRHGVKRSLRSPYLLASWAVVDPELTLGAPPALTGAAGMDALAQLVEAYVTRKSTPPVRALIRDALPRHLRALRVLAREPDDLEARSGACYGALVSGIALANAGLGAVHGFAAALGGITELPHGLVCAVFLPPVLRANAPVIRADLGELCAGAGMPDGVDPVEWLAGEVEALLDAYGLPRRLSRSGGATEAFGEAELTRIAGASSGSSMSGNPVPLDEEARLSILRAALVTGGSG